MNITGGFRFPESQREAEARSMCLKRILEAKSEALKSYDEISGVDQAMGKPGEVFVSSKEEVEQETVIHKESVSFDKEGKIKSYSSYDLSLRADSRSIATDEHMDEQIVGSRPQLSYRRNQRIYGGFNAGHTSENFSEKLTPDSASEIPAYIYDANILRSNKAGTTMQKSFQDRVR